MIDSQKRKHVSAINAFHPVETLGTKESEQAEEEIFAFARVWKEPATEATRWHQMSLTPDAYTYMYTRYKNDSNLHCEMHVLLNTVKTPLLRWILWDRSRMKSLFVCCLRDSWTMVHLDWNSNPWGRHLKRLFLPSKHEVRMDSVQVWYQDSVPSQPISVDMPLAPKHPLFCQTWLVSPV